MKNRILLFLFMLTGLATAFAQAPQKMSYQAVIRDGSEQLVKSRPIGIRTSILQGSVNGSVVYQEIYNPNPTSNINGLLTLQIGSGIPTSGSYVFENINWEVGPYYIRTEVDPTGGTNYSITGASELLSVPYALFAASGVKGEKGDKGDKGDAGTGVKIVGSLPTEAQLPSNYNGAVGDVYITQNTGHGWMWNGTSFIDIGEIKGPKGDKGDKGDIGLTGPVGPKGDKGDKGDQGIQGIPGINGADGANGEDGEDGEDGPQGQPGPEGPQGEIGPEGPQGNTGAQGPPGSANINGTSGFLVKFNSTTSGDNSIIKQENNKLTINSPVGSDGKLNVRGDAGGSGIHGESDVIGVNGEGASIGVRGAGGEYGVVASSGSVRSLRVDGNSQFQNVNNNDPFDGIIIAPDEGFAKIATYNEDLYIETYNDHDLILNKSTSAGNVGIGTEGPTAKFQILTHHPTSAFILENTLGNGMTVYVHSGKRAYYTDLGSVGIGVGSPDYRLQLSVNSAAKPTTNTWTVASDARLKKDVSSYSDGLNEILKINPVRFTYTGEAGMPQETGVGVLAQDLQQVAPYMVSDWTYKKDEEDTGKEYLAVDNGPMTYMLINAVKELNEEIENLREEINVIKTELLQSKTK